jgi:hypothetical protein
VVSFIQNKALGFISILVVHVFEMTKIIFDVDDGF